MKTNKEVIIEEAESLFIKFGFKKVTMGDIAKSSQISRPTLYSVFSDKQTVFSACVLEVVKEFQLEAQSKLNIENSIEDKLWALLSIFVIEPFNQFSKSEESYDILLNAETYAPEEMKTYWRTFEKLVQKVLETASNEKAIAPKDAAKVIVCFSRDARKSCKSLLEIKKLTRGIIQMAVKNV
ncbi:TetR/AcrR family transcriptional regulator [Vibrio rhizosphaerae]|uniref:TetR/AcrR family transcriptional regulator n=1 Tax=Vibrio rhizosphaerae TaxID=398736 RepID=A0ABU4IUP6_9VIBR|nr:TetR/AcrR family transcriptional regulator [Vibrio rhizosphaerae]MDW6092481.1 TetR/AcrR family transcriptional regulator [Vibrio rhizosphaerae]